MQPTNTTSERPWKTLYSSTQVLFVVTVRKWLYNKTVWIAQPKSQQKPSGTKVPVTNDEIQAR